MTENIAAADGPIRVRPAPWPASLVGADGRPSIASIKALARCIVNDPCVCSYGPWQPVLRSALRDAKAAAQREAERAALPPAARISRDRLDGLQAAHDALYFSPGRFAQTEPERRAIAEMMDAERARLDAQLDARMSSPLPEEYRRVA